MSDVELPVLEALEADPSLSQRELAQRVGLSLTRAHFVLKRLMERGLVKVRNAAQSDHKLGYLYLLTPQGMEEKASLTYAFLQRTAAQYQQMVDRVVCTLDGALDAVDTDEAVAVAVVGDGPLADVVRSIVSMRADVRVVEDAEEAMIAVDVTGRYEVQPAGSSSMPKTVRLA